MSMKYYEDSIKDLHELMLKYPPGRSVRELLEIMILTELHLIRVQIQHMDTVI